MRAYLKLFWLGLGLTALKAMAAQSGPLVRFDFEQNETKTGNAFRLFEQAKGTVRLSRAFALEGTQSLEIRDAAGDGIYPEFQGRFPVMQKGHLHTHFAIMVATPKDTFEVALAGPQGL